MIHRNTKRSGAIHLAALPLILMIANLVIHGHPTPAIHQIRMTRLESGKPVLLPKVLVNSHQRMLAYQARTGRAPVVMQAQYGMPAQVVPQAMAPVQPVRSELVPGPAVMARVHPGW